MKHLLLTTIAAVVLVGVVSRRVFTKLPVPETSKPSNSTWLLVLM